MAAMVVRARLINVIQIQQFTAESLKQLYGVVSSAHKSQINNKVNTSPCLLATNLGHMESSWSTIFGTCHDII